jgi:radical SAM superfamily enzyme YgiQ (UPF0313 family)
VLERQEFNFRVEAILDLASGDATIVGSARLTTDTDWFAFRFDCEAFEAALNADRRQQTTYPFDHPADWRRAARCIGPFEGRLIQLPTPDSDRAWCGFVGSDPAAIPPLTRFRPGRELLRGEPVLAPIMEGLPQGRSEPDVLLIALYHPENFPLPRFALGISDLARAMRVRGLGRVRLRDMQLDLATDDIVAEIERSRPDIVGISATFGQNDVLSAILDELEEGGAATDTRVIVGGSLAALNAETLVKRGVLVATGPGEATMAALVEQHCGLRGLETVPGLRHDGNRNATSGPAIDNRFASDFLPELDLAHATLAAGGAIQLESSRGCSYACSFCPRHHKGIWSGKEPARIRATVGALAQVFAEHPKRARKLFLVDEEFVGYRPEAECRARDVAAVMHDHGFGFETNARVDQVARRNRPLKWHAERVRFWRELVALGLERCLFGVESGIDTILTRFNKKTQSEQNVVAIRTLTAAGVPIRFTYITFDPLMTLDELVQSYRFLARTDLVMPECADLSDEKIVSLAHSDVAAAIESTGTPLYREISYQLVSMEALMGSPYLAEVEAQGLASERNLNMGRREARYRDVRIGAMSAASQLWIDRNFPADYFLKGLEKIAEPSLRGEVRAVRRIFKDYAHGLLGLMLSSAIEDDLPLPEIVRSLTPADRLFGELSGVHRDQPSTLAPPLLDLMDMLLTRLIKDVGSAIQALRPSLEGADSSLALQADKVFADWRRNAQWSLINA